MREARAPFYSYSLPSSHLLIHSLGMLPLFIYLILEHLPHCPPTFPSTPPSCFDLRSLIGSVDRVMLLACIGGTLDAPPPSGGSLSVTSVALTPVGAPISPTAVAAAGDEATALLVRQLGRTGSGRGWTGAGDQVLRVARAASLASHRISVQTSYEGSDGGGVSPNSGAFPDGGVGRGRGEGASQRSVQLHSSRLLSIGRSSIGRWTPPPPPTTRAAGGLRGRAAAPPPLALSHTTLSFPMSEGPPPSLSASVASDLSSPFDPNCSSASAALSPGGGGGVLDSGCPPCPLTPPSTTSTSCSSLGSAATREWSPREDGTGSPTPPGLRPRWLQPSRIPRAPLGSPTSPEAPHAPTLPDLLLQGTSPSSSALAPSRRAEATYVEGDANRVGVASPPPHSPSLHPVTPSPGKRFRVEAAQPSAAASAFLTPRLPPQPRPVGLPKTLVSSASSSSVATAASKTIGVGGAVRGMSPTQMPTPGARPGSRSRMSPASVRSAVTSPAGPKRPPPQLRLLVRAEQTEVFSSSEGPTLFSALTGRAATSRTPFGELVSVGGSGATCDLRRSHSALSALYRHLPSGPNRQRLEALYNGLLDDFQVSH